MSAIPGSVRLGGFAAPMDSTDTYAVTDPTYGRGGLRSVANIAARNAITKDRRYNITTGSQLGMEVVTIDTMNKYRLIHEPGTAGTTNSDWQLVEISSSDFTWDGSIPFGTFYATNDIASLDKAVVIILQGSGHIINNKGSQYTNMAYVAFNSLDQPRTITIYQNATLDNLPMLLNNITLNSASTNYIVTNPVALENAYIGTLCSLALDMFTPGAKFINLNGGAGLNLGLNGGSLYGAGIFILEGNSTLYMDCYNNPFLDPTCITGISTDQLNLQFTSDVQMPYPSQFINFAGGINYAKTSINDNLTNNPTVNWDGSVAFSDFYAMQNINSLAGSLSIFLTGTGHTINNKGSQYTGMGNIIFTSPDNARTINIAQGVTFDAQPKLKDNVTLQSQSTAAICTNISSVYIGINCALKCDSTVTGAKFISLSGGTTSCTFYMLNGRISNAGVISLASSCHLQLEMYVASYLDGTSISGTSGTVIIYSDNTCDIPYKSGFTNYTGSLLYDFNGDANLLKKASIVSWDGLVAFSDFYKLQNISTLTGTVTVNLTGTGHTIDNLGTTYTGMKYVAFQSLDTVRTINIAPSAVIDNVPTLINGVILKSQSTASICINPASPINVGYNCTLKCDIAVSGAKFVSLTTTHLAACYLNSGSIFGVEVFQLAGTSTLSIAALNVSQIDPNSIYGISGTNLYLNFDADSPAVSPSDLTNFAGTFHDLTLAVSSQIQGGELQLANLAALNAWPFASQLVVGQWGCTQDNGKKYRLDSISPRIWTEFAAGGGSTAFADLTGKARDNADLASELNSISQTIGSLNPEADNWYFENQTIQGTGSENDVPLKILDTIPSGAIEYDSTIVVNSVTPVIHAAFVNPNSQSYMAGFKAGISALKLWAKVSSAAANTYMQVNAMQYHTYTDLTVSVAGTGTTRTVTATGNVFVTGDANPNPTISNYLETPKGRYGIIGIIGDSPSNQCLILVPSGYGNETAVSFSKYSKIYQMVSPNITNTAALQEITCFSNPQLEFSPAYSNWYWNHINSDKIAFFVFGVTDSLPSVAITFAYNGWTTCSHVETPEILLVKSHSEPSVGGGIAQNIREQQINTSATQSFFFSIPSDMRTLLSAHVGLFSATGFNSALDKDVYYSDGLGATNNQYTAQLLAVPVIFTESINSAFSILDLLTNAIAGTIGTVKVHNNSVTAVVQITGVYFNYIPY